MHPPILLLPCYRSADYAQKYHSLAAKGEKVKLEPKEVNDVPNGDTSAHSTQSNAADAFTAPADTEPASVGVQPRIGPAAIPAMPSISQTLAGSGMCGRYISSCALELLTHLQSKMKA